MPDSNLEAAIQEAYASAPSDEVILHTIELRHPLFLDDKGQHTTVRVVRNYADADSWLAQGGADVQAVLDGLGADARDQVGLVAKLEPDAVQDGGQYVPFVAMAFELLPPRVDTGASPELTVTMDNVGREISDQLDRAAVSRDTIEVIYRPYLSTDISRPQTKKPVVMELTNVEVDLYRVVGRARMFDIGAKRFPSVRYLAKHFPGLIR